MSSEVFIHPERVDPQGLFDFGFQKRTHGLHALFAQKAFHHARDRLLLRVIRKEKARELLTHIDKQYIAQIQIAASPDEDHFQNLLWCHARKQIAQQIFDHAFGHGRDDRCHRLGIVLSGHSQTNVRSSHEEFSF